MAHITDIERIIKKGLQGVPDWTDKVERTRWNQYDFKLVRIMKKDGTATTISIKHPDYIRLNNAAMKAGFRSGTHYLRMLAAETDEVQQQKFSHTLRTLAQEKLGVKFGQYWGKRKPC